jgi:hypothetical protein
MLRSTLAAVAFGASLWAFAWLDSLVEPIARAGAAVAIGVFVTALAYGQATFLSIGIGALSPLAFSLLERHSLGLAATALCSIWMLPRLVLAPSSRSLGLLVAVSIAASAVAGFVFAAYVDAGWAAELASCLFAGSCLSLVGLVPVDTGVAFALRAAAAAIDDAAKSPKGGSPARQALERAARWHRQSHASPSQWRALGRLADERAALQRSKATENERARKDLDERIEALAAELAPVDPASSPAAVAGPTEPAPTEAAPTEVSSDTHASDPAEITAE